MQSPAVTDTIYAWASASPRRRTFPNETITQRRSNGTGFVLLIQIRSGVELSSAVLPLEENQLRWYKSWGKPLAQGFELRVFTHSRPSINFTYNIFFYSHVKLLLYDLKTNRKRWFLFSKKTSFLSVHYFFAPWSNK